MLKKHITGIYLKKTFSLICYSLAATMIPTGAGQIAEPPEHAQQHQHHTHFMNVPMGEEKCEVLENRSEARPVDCFRVSDLETVLSGGKAAAR